jgi:hypothetical protein
VSLVQREQCSERRLDISLLQSNIMRLVSSYCKVHVLLVLCVCVCVCVCCVRVGGGGRLI